MLPAGARLAAEMVHSQTESVQRASGERSVEPHDAQGPAGRASVMQGLKGQGHKCRHYPRHNDREGRET